MRKTPFVNGEIYHIYNRGTDKRIIFSDDEEMDRFMQSMEEFNTIEPIGSIYENSILFAKSKKLGSSASKKQPEQLEDKLVNFISYCLNPNHYHFLLEQIAENGIVKFMQRLSNGYTKYFNNKNSRNGVLFQGRFKSIHIDSNEYLLHISAYVNLNDRVHQLGHSMSKSDLVRSRSSWEEYVGNRQTSSDFCNKDIILGQFESKDDYRDFAEDSLRSILGKRRDDDPMASLLLE